MSQPASITPAHDDIDEIEAIQEGDRVVYVFRSTDAATAEELADEWATTGMSTWTSSRPATAEDLAVASDALDTFDR